MGCVAEFAHSIDGVRFAKQRQTQMQTIPNSSLIRVALVEDDAEFQKALSDSISAASDMVLLKVAATRAGGLQMLEEMVADVLLVDLGLPDGSGIDVIQAAHQKWPRCNIMVSTTFGDEQHVLRSLEAGAVGYLLKDSAPEKMVLEIRSLYAGGSPISPLIARQILLRFHPAEPAYTPSATAHPQATLSARELEVLKLITKGFTYDEIAALMLVSRQTVMTYVRRIYFKLKVNSKIEAIEEARNQGLLAK